LKIRNSTGEVKVMSVTNVLLMVFNVLFFDYNSLERYFTGTKKMLIDFAANKK
jgi:hypothetical protein